ncbi:hypothetical protein [Burkholderia gladioli]|uniref:hypothetical protein n=1 Tax=Burkholderia gladioli TaxID=28095 RepID=UPI0016415939|nr:hypothetical protein [Burkholderia gladioli]
MSNHAEVNNFQKEIAPQNGSEFQARVEKIDALIKSAAREFEEGSTAILKKGMNAAYEPFYVFVTSDERTQSELDEYFRRQCQEKGLKVTERKTTFSHMVVMLVFGNLRTDVKSQRARCLRKAAGIDSKEKRDAVAPKDFLQWLEENDGINGSVGGNKDSSASATRKRKQYIETARTSLAKTSIKGKISNLSGNSLEGLNEGQAFVAIVEKDSTGNLVVKAFVQSENAVSEAYAAYGKSITN